ncbi:MAG: UDP-N-acetylmuramoyl-L-alanyl-D-glutamate--2,6-diaminopimelate ligase [Rhodothermales bacterium]|nr:UDP-N-acetylmuramoyl-L-alanyl-D-glutamate--2,6-diaminopimelate ligase [Rhodothermales bacterium]
MIAVQELIDTLTRNDLLLSQERVSQVLINTVTNDSRRVGPKDLFIAIKGEQSDGHMFIDKAVKNGAIAIVYEVASAATLGLPAGVTGVHVRDARKAEAIVAAALYGNPATSLRMIGVTGTNGKTSTTYLIHGLLQKAGISSGLIGTVETLTGKRSIDSKQTTPGPLDLHELLNEMRENDCTACAMEVSSHAIRQDRIFGIPFHVAAFTNLTQDHLDYHSSMDEYFNTKKRLFDELPSGAFAVTNMNDARGSDIIRDTRAARIRYGSSSRNDVGFVLKNQNMNGLEIEINGRSAHFNLLGEFNASNLACAYAVGLAMGIDEDNLFDFLSLSTPIPGRFESISTDDERLIVVDYAHTPDALDKVLSALIHIKRQDARLWCVFGCGGDRDTKKRPLMAAVAEKWSDEIVVTSDNPRTENPQEILNEIEEGFSESSNVKLMVDRGDAIRYVADHSQPGDVILVAGKGSETYQVIGNERVHFDDREKAREYFGVNT